MHTLKVTSESQRKIVLNQYAVVIELGERTRFQTLTKYEYHLEQLVTADGSETYQFKDLRANATYVCDLNHEVHANPAMSRGN